MAEPHPYCDGPRPWHRHYNAGVDPFLVPRRETVTEMMSASYERFADTVFIEYYGQQITYAAMRDRVAQAAAALRAAGIARGDRVALHLPNCPWHPIFFFATLAAGGVVTHLSPLDAEEEIRHKLEDSGAKLVISLSTPEFAGRFAGLIGQGACPPVVLCPDPVSAQGRDCPIGPGCIEAGAFLAPHEGAAYAPEAVTPDDLALLQFTGGTTGLPKAAQLTHFNLTATSQIYTEMSKGEPSAAPGRASLQYSPLFHIMGLSSGMLKRAREGGTLCLRLRFDPVSCLDEIERLRIASLGGVPTLWIALLQVPGIETRDLSSLEYAGSGGAPLPVEVYSRIKALTGLKLRGGWGMTETAPAGTAVPASMPDSKLGTIGVPLCGLDIRIVDVDDPQRDLPPGEPGEMLIRGPNVMTGYWQRPDETREAFVDGWFKTGDIGYMDEDGWFFLVDRKKDLILSGGFNVYPLVIENAVHQHPSVSEAIAIGVPDPYRGESAKVFVVLNRGAERFTLEELQDFLAEKLGRHEMPRHLEFREELPHTPVGKPWRRKLAEEERARLAEAQA